MMRDRPLVEDFVKALVARQNLVQCILDRHIGQPNGVLPVLELLIVGDVDAGCAADEVEDVPETRVRKLDLERLARRRVQQRRRSFPARLLTHPLDRRPRTRRLDAVSNRPLEIDHLRRRPSVRRIRTRWPCDTRAPPPTAPPAPRTRGRLPDAPATRRASLAGAQSCSRRESGSLERPWCSTPPPHPSHPHACWPRRDETPGPPRIPTRCRGRRPISVTAIHCRVTCSRLNLFTEIP